MGLAAAASAYFALKRWPLVGVLEAWQLTLMLTGIPGLFLAFLVFTFREPPRRVLAESAERKVEFMPFLCREWRVLTPMLAGMMLCSVGVLSLGAWVPTFVERTYALKPQQFGPILSTIHLIGAGFLLCKGMFVDWLRARGIVDAHLRFFSWIVAVSIPLALAAFLASTSTWLFWLFYGTLEILAGQFLLYFAATVQLFSPPELRGRIMALFQAAFTVIGMGLGPLMVAFITERVFADPGMIGTSLALVVSISFALAFLSLRMALPQVRRVVGQNGQEFRP